MTTVPYPDFGYSENQWQEDHAACLHGCAFVFANGRCRCPRSFPLRRRLHRPQSRGAAPASQPKPASSRREKKFERLNAPQTEAPVPKGMANIYHPLLVIYLLRRVAKLAAAQLPSLRRYQHSVTQTVEQPLHSEMRSFGLCRRIGLILRQGQGPVAWCVPRAATPNRCHRWATHFRGHPCPRFFPSRRLVQPRLHKSMTIQGTSRFSNLLWIRGETENDFESMSGNFDRLELNV
ncbi:hypothetical protein F5B22DRAFT_17559 [Xylaria bambusicola]|uniref:uncharacterized protein n=1 Tax=Xylaria bambusicola TaxID=326684 RepID=UPI002008B2B9|nr:uncharacterized protein F5B22DRAFT_17559 [Xylaria bambusicola]KAI0528059.1 hypothetical protein F5B22DRAFT_17559 [Xylaria bambusicola]